VTYDVWTGDGFTALPAATSGGESVMTPNINGLVYCDEDPGRILLQRRDKPGEVVRGKLELPGGRWRAGEQPQDALAREIFEETGVTVVDLAGLGAPYRPAEHVGIATLAPRLVVSGYDGAYPSVHVVVECRGAGEPRPLVGETADPRWWLIDEVRTLLDSDPEAFVWHSYAMLQAAL
jgi:8-oxo-dGTP pyrophosphatase MutT (NUDIX family)